MSDGNSVALSPDGKWAVNLPSAPRRDQFEFNLIPTGVGTPRTLPKIQGSLQWVDWTPDGKNIVYGVSEGGHPSRLSLQEIATGKTRAFTHEGVEFLLYSHLISPD